MARVASPVTVGVEHILWLIRHRVPPEEAARAINLPPQAYDWADLAVAYIEAAAGVADSVAQERNGCSDESETAEVLSAPRPPGGPITGPPFAAGIGRIESFTRFNDCHKALKFQAFRHLAGWLSRALSLPALSRLAKRRAREQ